MAEVLEEPYFRMDFEQEVISFNEAERTVQFRMIPDPRRYEEATIKGEEFYLDKYLGFLIPKDEIKKSAASCVGLPVYALKRPSQSMVDYISERQEAVLHEVETGTHIAPKHAVRPHIPLPADTRNLAFISVDICNSTNSRTENRDGYDLALELFYKELGAVVAQFEGQIHKLTGDGFIAVIDHPSTNLQCDNAVDMALGILAILNKSVLPALKSKNLPIIKTRTGLDYGLALIKEFAIPASGFSQRDISSDALNRAVKIQEMAEPNQILLGRTLYERLHVQWLERCKQHNKFIAGLNNYRVYRLR